MYVILKHIKRGTKILASGEIKTYCYMRGTRDPLPGKEGSPEFMATYYAALAKRTQQTADDKTVQTFLRPAPGSTSLT